MKKLKILVGFILVMAFASYSTAHHSVANFNFEESERRTIQGVVTYWSFTNPHSFINVEVTEENGEAVLHTIFLTSRVALQRYGWRPKSLMVGDEVEIEGAPDRKKPAEMLLQRIVFPDGKVWRRDEISL